MARKIVAECQITGRNERSLAFVAALEGIAASLASFVPTSPAELLEPGADKRAPLHAVAGRGGGGF